MMVSLMVTTITLGAVTIITDTKVRNAKPRDAQYKLTDDRGLCLLVAPNGGKWWRFNYRFDWFDAQGLPVSTPTATMVSQTIEAGQILVLTSVAPTPTAKDFRLTVQQSTREFFPLLRKN